MYVPSNKKTGWVSKSYISVGKSIATSVSKGTAYYVTANSLNIRKEPTINSEKLFAAKKNEKLILSEIKSNWGKVTTASGRQAGLLFLT